MRFQSFDYPLSAIDIHFPQNSVTFDFMKILHSEVRASEEAAEITRKLGWEVHNDQIEPGSFGGRCDAAWMTEAQFHRRQAIQVRARPPVPGQRSAAVRSH